MGAMATIAPLIPLESSAAAVLSGLETSIPFVFREKEALVTEVDTPSLCLPYSPEVIPLSSPSSSYSSSLYSSTGAITHKYVKEDGVGVHGACGNDDGGQRRYHIEDVDDHCRWGWIRERD